MRGSPADREKARAQRKRSEEIPILIIVALRIRGVFNAGMAALTLVTLLIVDNDLRRFP